MGNSLTNQTSDQPDSARPIISSRRNSSSKSASARNKQSGSSSHNNTAAGPSNFKDTMDSVWNEIDGKLPKVVTAILIGAGLRGQGYAYYAEEFPSRMKMVGVAEPTEHRRKKVRELYGLQHDMVFSDWKDLADRFDGNGRKPLADLVIISTPDRFHKDPAIAFANQGYSILLEKPMSVNEHECEEITAACLQNDTLISIGHVMRYLPVSQKIREIIDSGVIGELVTIEHRENINYWHFAHSFVRGNWLSEKVATFSLLAKSCHDIDLICHWLGDRKCLKVQSFGGLKHFKPEKKPEGASERCLDCAVESQCPYSAQKIYLKGGLARPSWPQSAVCDIEDHPKGYRAALMEALDSGPYGRCVYACDNDVADHQIVNFEFEDEIRVSFVMNAFTDKMCRETRMCGTRGQINWTGGSNSSSLTVVDFNDTSKSGKVDSIPQAPPCKTRAHGGADFFFMDALVKAIAKNDRSSVITGIQDSLRSHKLVFAAERSRKNGGQTVEIDF